MSLADGEVCCFKISIIFRDRRTPLTQCRMRVCQFSSSLHHGHLSASICLFPNRLARSPNLLPVFGSVFRSCSPYSYAKTSKDYRLLSRLVYKQRGAQGTRRRSKEQRASTNLCFGSIQISVLKEYATTRGEQHSSYITHSLARGENA